jgi:hypothetical protein
VNLTNDHRDALLRQVALQAAPDHLADVAQKAGMIPTNSPIFIDISVPIK